MKSKKQLSNLNKKVQSKKRNKNLTGGGRRPNKDMEGKYLFLDVDKTLVNKSVCHYRSEQDLSYYEKQEDYTELIRELKHSEILRNDIKNLLFLKNKYNNDQDKVQQDAVSECNFIFTYYTDIYNKLRKDELDIDIFYQFLDVLHKIEEGELNQHEGSFIVGSILKKLYVDSALRKADKLNDNGEEIQPQQKKADKEISWKNFKLMNTN